eukprot:7911006-Pyramimonas_sp.AAC.1
MHQLHTTAYTLLEKCATEVLDQTNMYHSRSPARRTPIPSPYIPDVSLMSSLMCLRVGRRGSRTKRDPSGLLVRVASRPTQCPRLRHRASEAPVRDRVLHILRCAGQ